jgi:hypothetical protein
MYFKKSKGLVIWNERSGSDPPTQITLSPPHKGDHILTARKQLKSGIYYYHGLYHLSMGYNPTSIVQCTDTGPSVFKMYQKNYGYLVKSLLQTMNQNISKTIVANKELLFCSRSLNSSKIVRVTI